MHPKIRYLIFFFLLSVSCCKEDLPPHLIDEEGVVLSMPYSWKVQLTYSDNSSAFGYIYYPVVHEKNFVIFTSDANGDGRLSMVNSENGKFKWQWNDVFSNSTSIDYQINRKLVRDGLMFCQSGKRGYCVDLESGTTKWRLIRNQAYNTEVASYKENFIITGLAISSNNHDEQIAYIGNKETGEIEEFLRTNLSGSYASPATDNGFIGGIIYVNKTQSEENKVLVTYDEALPDWQLQPKFGLYNITTHQWEYEGKNMSPTTHWNNNVPSIPIVYNNKVYASVGKSLICHDFSSGNQLWRKEFDQDFFFSGFIVEDGMLIANCEDTYTYRLDPSTGATLWRTKGAGTSSRMSYLNGVVYFVGGSTGYLHAVEAASGRVLWRIDGRRLGGGPFTTNAVYCVPGEGGGRGRVIALTNRYAYCFEAAQ